MTPKERPILFSGPMVQAILDGRKTQTRRVMRVQPPTDEHVLSLCMDTTGDRRMIGKRHWITYKDHCITDSDERYFNLPYGAVGDRLYVRETWTPNLGTNGGILYRADYGRASFVQSTDLKKGMHTVDMSRWKPSIHMPCWASRITLEITGVRVERLQDISEEDAKAEGTEKVPLHNNDVYGEDLRVTFSRLWDKINGKKYPWSSNPFVWVVEFQKQEKR